MHKYAIIENDKVVNIILWDEVVNLEIPKLVKIEGYANIGYYFINGQFTKELPQEE